MVYLKALYSSSRYLHNFLDTKPFFFHFFYLHKNLQHMWSLNKLVYYIVDLCFIDFDSKSLF